MQAACMAPVSRQPMDGALRHGVGSLLPLPPASRPTILVSLWLVAVAAYQPKCQANMTTPLQCSTTHRLGGGTGYKCVSQKQGCDWCASATACGGEPSGGCCAQLAVLPAGAGLQPGDPTLTVMSPKIHLCCCAGCIDQKKLPVNGRCDLRESRFECCYLVGFSWPKGSCAAHGARHAGMQGLLTMPVSPSLSKSTACCPAPIACSPAPMCGGQGPVHQVR